MRLANAEQAEAAFYQAFERADLAAMMAVWAEDEDIICVHPCSERVSGFDAVRESWRQIFASGMRLRFQLIDLKTHGGRLLTIHNLHERITVNGELGPPHLVLATNVYIHTGGGWRMFMHHASPLAPGTLVSETQAGTVH